MPVSAMGTAGLQQPMMGGVVPAGMVPVQNLGQPQVGSQAVAACAQCRHAACACCSSERRHRDALADEPGAPLQAQGMAQQQQQQQQQQQLLNQGMLQQPGAMMQQAGMPRPMQQVGQPVRCCCLAAAGYTRPAVAAAVTCCARQDCLPHQVMPAARPAGHQLAAIPAATACTAAADNATAGHAAAGHAAEASAGAAATAHAAGWVWHGARAAAGAATAAAGAVHRA
jgi:hypothetical protein